MEKSQHRGETPSAKSQFLELHESGGVLNFMGYVSVNDMQEGEEVKLQTPGSSFPKAEVIIKRAGKDFLVSGTKAVSLGVKAEGFNFRFSPEGDDANFEEAMQTDRGEARDGVKRTFNEVRNQNPIFVQMQRGGILYVNIALSVPPAPNKDKKDKK